MARGRLPQAIKNIFEKIMNIKIVKDLLKSAKEVTTEDGYKFYKTDNGWADSPTETIDMEYPGDELAQQIYDDWVGIDKIDGQDWENAYDTQKKLTEKRDWVVYLLKCQPKTGSKTTLYCGITNDLEARFAAHQAGTGAKYTRANPPIEILAVREGFIKSEASKIEYAIKKLPAKDKAAALMDFQLPEEKIDDSEYFYSEPRM